MGVTFIAPQGTYTSPAKLITKTITENNTYNAADDNANGYSSVTVNVEGGGGGGDFTTAEVTVTLDNINYWYWKIPVVENNPKKLVVNNYQQTEATETHTVPLYGGVLEFYPDSFVSATSGNITEEEGVLTITGDCSITFTQDY